MAGFIPGLLPTSHTQEMEFAQAYEDVLERYKGKAFVGKGRGALCAHSRGDGNECQFRLFHCVAFWLNVLSVCELHCILTVFRQRAVVCVCSLSGVA